MAVIHLEGARGVRPCRFNLESSPGAAFRLRRAGYVDEELDAVARELGVAPEPLFTNLLVFELVVGKP